MHLSNHHYAIILDLCTDCAYHHSMEFEWDPRKAKENLRKHGVDFANAVITLEDENALIIEDPDHDELRFEMLGMGPTLNILFVAHCKQSTNSIRIISARKADKKELKFYFQGLIYE